VSTERRLESRTGLDLHLRPDLSLIPMIFEAIPKTRLSRLSRASHPPITQTLQHLSPLTPHPTNQPGSSKPDDCRTASKHQYWRVDWRGDVTLGPPSGSLILLLSAPLLVAHHLFRRQSTLLRSAHPSMVLPFLTCL